MKIRKKKNSGERRWNVTLTFVVMYMVQPPSRLWTSLFLIKLADVQNRNKLVIQYDQRDSD